MGFAHEAQKSVIASFRKRYFGNNIKESSGDR
jgi:hypothetical protein